jgi:DnaK suppressor protein
MATKKAKKYAPDDKEKYMCSKHKIFFKKKLDNWKKEITESSENIAKFSETNGDLSAPDILDQATSQTEKSIEMRTFNRQRKLLIKINQALGRLKEDTYGYCEETGEPIGLKRLIARPIATLSVDAQEKRERKEKIFAEI